MCMENTTQRIVLSRPLSLKKHCRASFFTQEASQAGTQLNHAVITKKIPDELVEPLLTHATKRKNAEYFSTLLQQSSSTQSLYPSLGLTLARQNSNDQEKKQKKITTLLRLCTNQQDKEILKIFRCCIDNEMSADADIFGTALSHHYENTCLFLLKHGCQPRKKIVERTIETMVIKYPILIDMAFHSKKIMEYTTEACQWHKNNNKFSALDDETFNYYFISQHIFNQGIQQLKILKKLHFIPNDKGFIELEDKSYQEKNKITLNNYLFTIMHYLNSNFEYLCLEYGAMVLDHFYGSMMPENQKDQEQEIINEMIFSAVGEYYKNNPEKNTLNNLLAMNTGLPSTYTEHLKKFMQIRHHALHFCFKVFKLFKEYYPQEFTHIKSIKKATKDYCNTTEPWKPYNIPQMFNEK